MNLKRVERICQIGVILFLVCVLGIYSNISPGISQFLGWTAIAIVFVLLIFNLRYNRCPKCGTYLWRTTEFCKSCGENLQKYR